jgi:hypothetical protein
MESPVKAFLKVCEAQNNQYGEGGRSDTLWTHLLKTEELQYGEVDGRVETQATLIRAQGRVVLVRRIESVEQFSHCCRMCLLEHDSHGLLGFDLCHLPKPHGTV